MFPPCDLIYLSSRYQRVPVKKTQLPMGSSAGIAISCVSNNEDETQDEPSNFRNHHVTSVLSPIRTTFPYCALKKLQQKQPFHCQKCITKTQLQSTSIFSGRRSSHKCDFGTTTVAPFSALKLSSKAQTVAMEKGCRGRGTRQNWSS